MTYRLVILDDDTLEPTETVWDSHGLNIRITHLPPTVSAELARLILPWQLRDDIVTGKAGKRQRDRTASKWAPVAEPSTRVCEAETAAGIVDQHRRRRNRAAMAARGWAHIT